MTRRRWLLPGPPWRIEHLELLQADDDGWTVSWSRRHRRLSYTAQADAIATIDWFLARDPAWVEVDPTDPSRPVDGEPGTLRPR